MVQLRANLLLLGCAAIWGMAFLFQKSAMAHVEPWLFVAARSFVAAVVLAPFAYLEHRRAAAPCGDGFARIAVIAGVLLLIAAVSQQRGIVNASVINTAFLTALYVVVTPLVAWALLSQRPSGAVWIAVVLSFLGAWLLGGGGLTTFGSGEALIIASTLFWALHIAALGIAAPRGRPVLLMAIQFALVAPLAMVGACAVETIEFAALRRAAVDILFVGVFSSALAFTLFAAAMRGTSPVVATIIVSTEAVFAAVGAYLLLGERLTAAGGFGALLILAAALVAQLSPRAAAAARG